MNKPHKHRELIKAWADGAVIERFSPASGKWLLNYPPTWHERDLYRIKPQSQKMYVRLCKTVKGLIVSMTAVDKLSLAGVDYNWVSDWVEIELYSKDE